MLFEQAILSPAALFAWQGLAETVRLLLTVRMFCNVIQSWTVGVLPMKSTTKEERGLTPEQQQIVDDGLRILARMIVRRHMKETASREHQGGGPPEADNTADGGAR